MLRSDVEILERTVAEEPEFASSDLHIVESDWEDLQRTVQDVEGEPVVGRIQRTEDAVRSGIERLDVAIQDFEQLEARYFEVMDPTPFDNESRLLSDAQSILQTAPSKRGNLLEKVGRFQVEGAILVEHARNLVG